MRRGRTWRSAPAIAGALALAVFAASAATSAGGKRRAEAAVFQPVFATSAGELRAGKAFVATLDGCPEPLLITAIHLFGPGGGLPTAFSPAQLATDVATIRLGNIARPGVRTSFAADSLGPPGANPCCSDAPMTGVGDIAAFRAPEALRAVALPVAAATPAAGAHVFVVTSVLAERRATMRFEAVVRGVEQGYLVYDFVTPGFVVQATSGAPVVDADGAVVGINLGGGGRGDRGFGIGNPVSNWRAAVVAACTAGR